MMPERRCSINMPPTFCDKQDNLCDQPASEVMSELHQPSHKRVYQACIPCRRRKVRCDLGSVDNPSDPPCVRCRRESKECYFSATRRKRKYMDNYREDATDRDDYFEDYTLRNRRKMVAVLDSPPTCQGSLDEPQSATSSNSAIDLSTLHGLPLTPGGSIGRFRPLRKPNHHGDDSHSISRARDSSTHLENLEAQEVMRQQVYGPYDALDLLYKAATDNTSIIGDDVEHQLPVEIRKHIPYSHQSSPTVAKVESRGHQNSRRLEEIRRGERLDPSLSSNKSPQNVKNIERTKRTSYDDAIKAWARFRFVRAGWFTAAEAIDYIDYYYEYLSPLTPISPPTFQDPATHLTLLTEEPFLAVTLLSIATRFRQITEPGGQCRSHAIHEQLWTYLRGMIERCLWGQEAFGGRFYGSAIEADPINSISASRKSFRKGNLRSLGTIESLMILTEWHPRALHFPPVDVTDELMIPSYEETCSTDKDDTLRIPSTVRGVGGKRIESWLEPAWRSDRMCWMLLSTAMGLSYELGVYDNFDTLLATYGEISRPEYEDEAYRLRATRIKRLLSIYATQLAGRLGWTCMMPGTFHSTDTPFATQKPVNSPDPHISDTKINFSDNFNYIPDLELDDQVIHCWAGITNVMRHSNELLFKSRQHTTKIIQDGSYVELLLNFQPMLRDWKKEFELFRLPPYIRHVLTIEYEYTRIYIYSLSLQAVVERCANNAGLHAGAPVNGINSTIKQPLSPAVRDYYGKIPLARLGGMKTADQSYVKEVVDGSRKLLKTVVEGLLPNDYLKHAPVRTYFRIISGAMFLLKTFALGASKSDVEISIRLMDRAVDALRNCIVDDVHLGNRFADLLETLTSRLRNRFISALAGPPSNEYWGQSRSYIQSESDEIQPKSNDIQNASGWNISIPSIPPIDNNSENCNNNADYGVSATPFSASPSDLPFISTSLPSVYPVFETGSGHRSDRFPERFIDPTNWSSGNEVWYLPPGMAFFENINEHSVAQTSEGVHVGGMDLLDFMALDPSEPFRDMTNF